MRHHWPPAEIALGMGEPFPYHSWDRLASYLCGEHVWDVQPETGHKRIGD